LFNSDQASKVRENWKRRGGRCNAAARFGAPAWQERTAKLLGLESTLRPRGRPVKGKLKLIKN